MNLHPTIARARDEFAAKPAMRVGVWVIVAILAGYILFDVQAGRLATAAADQASTADRLARSRALLGRDDWTERLDAARAWERNLAERFWHADNPGLAQARLRTDIETLLAEVDTERSYIRLGLSQPVDGIPSDPSGRALWRIQVQVSGTARRRAILPLLHAVATYPRKLVEDRLMINRLSNDRRGDTRYEMLLTAYFVIGESPRAPAPAASESPGA